MVVGCAERFVLLDYQNQLKMESMKYQMLISVQNVVRVKEIAPQRLLSCKNNLDVDVYGMLEVE